jgi:hypothetical protein
MGEINHIQVSNLEWIHVLLMFTVTSSKGNRWSAITARMGMFLGAWPMCCSDHVQPYVLTALAVYTRSPAAIEALRSFKLL